MKCPLILEAGFCALLMFSTVSCSKKVAAESAQESDTGPKPAPVVPDMDANNLKVEHPDQFPVVAAGSYLAAPELAVTGVVSPDVSRQVPVPSLASGRVVEIDARLGDVVKQGDLLFKVRSTDISGAYSDYRKAVKNEELAKIQLIRNQTLYDAGAVAKSLLEIAQTTEENANVDVETTAARLSLLGSDPNHPTDIIEVHAPVSGVITDQQITNSAGVQALSAPNPFTISDISHVWIVCDVYENDLAQVNMGEYADIHLNAYPGRLLRGRIGNIAQIMDPALRTAKVRLEVENPGLMRFGMFVTASFHGEGQERHASVPADAILHLHDRDWVYLPTQNGGFRRVEVRSGIMLPGNKQEIVSGIKPGDRLVANALVLQNTVEQ